MTDRQPELQTILEQLKSDAPEDKIRAYFQPPVNVEMEYPCIRYSRDIGYTTFAGNMPYFHIRRYTLTLISRDPNPELYDLIVNLPMCLHQQSYAADKLNHDVFSIYF